MWTEERWETAKKLWVRGYSGSAIAAEIGATRSAVLARLNRAGFRRASDTVPRNRSLKARADRARARRAKQAAEAPKRVLLPVIAVAPLPPDPPIVPKKSFAELEPGDCRFGVGDPRHPNFGFCGNPVVPGLSWCSGCARLVFAAPEASSRSVTATRVKETA